MTGWPSDAIRPCTACRRADAAALLGELPVTQAKSFSRKSFALVECARCDHIYLSPLPTNDDVDAMYRHHGLFKTATYTSEERVHEIQRFLNVRLSSVLRDSRLEQRGTLRFLEVGAGLAWMCRVAKSRNQKHFTVAQDISPSASTQCPWVDHYVVDEVASSQIKRLAPFDIISLTHVIEHLLTPDTVLSALRDLLSPEGIIFVTAPHRPAGWLPTKSIEIWQSYSLNHVPAHINYFSETSLRCLGAEATLDLAYWRSSETSGAFEAWLVHSGTGG